MRYVFDTPFADVDKLFVRGHLFFTHWIYPIEPDTHGRSFPTVTQNTS